MNSETNETDKGKGTKKGNKEREKKQRLTTANNQSYLTELHVMTADKYSQNRMQRHSAVRDVKSGVVQNVPDAGF